MDHTLRLNVNHQFKSNRYVNICNDCLSAINFDHATPVWNGNRPLPLPR